MKTSKKGINFIASHEGFVPYLYDDLTQKPWGKAPTGTKKGTPTIGYGHTKDAKEIFQKYGKIDRDFGKKLLSDDIKAAERIVNRKVKTPITQKQFDALVSHTFNTGGSDTLFKLVNNPQSEIVRGGKSFDLGEWWKNTYTTSKGVKLRGLIRRRAEEFSLFSGSDNLYFSIIAVLLAVLMFFLVYG